MGSGAAEYFAEVGLESLGLFFCFFFGGTSILHVSLLLAHEFSKGCNSDGCHRETKCPVCSFQRILLFQPGEEDEKGDGTCSDSVKGMCKGEPREFSLFYEKAGLELCVF